MEPETVDKIIKTKVVEIRYLSCFCSNCVRTVHTTLDGFKKDIERWSPDSWTGGEKESLKNRLTHVCTEDDFSFSRDYRGRVHIYRSASKEVWLEKLLAGKSLTRLDTNYGNNAGYRLVFEYYTHKLVDGFIVNGKAYPF